MVKGVFFFLEKNLINEEEISELEHCHFAICNKIIVSGRGVNN